MRRVANRAAFSLERRVLVREGTLLIRVTFDASRIGASGEPCLLEFKTAMRIMAVTAFHGPFKNLVMERLGKIGLHFTMTTHAELRLAHLQYANCRDAWFLSVRLRHKDV